LACAAIISSWGGSIAMIMAAGAIISFLALLLQLIQLRQLLGTSQVGPSYISGATSQLLHLGCLTWMLAVSGVIFSYADRLVGGATLGAVAVASYAVCAQLSQPVYGLTAAGLHFLFPYLSRIHGDGEQSAGNRIVRLALLVNLALVLTGTGFLLTFGNSILRLLSTDAVANASAPLLRPVLAGSALLGLTVVGTYGMLALGRARSVAILNVLASIAAVAIVSWLLPTLGVLAIPAARIAFATIVMLLYIPLFRALRSSTISRAGFTSREARLEEA
jgi:O-antigen/teichoic acid export membrane protein